ncbi:MAG TPA: hypothetical protein VJX74_08340 [Blastocatellia bacterium]|nr:hypothetical protein [Blastocatellia bacterium]
MAGWETKRAKPGSLIKFAEQRINDARQANRQNAEFITNYMTNVMPVGDPKDGHIVDTVSVIEVDESTLTAGYGDENHKYAAAIEFGTRHRPARAPLTQATELGKQDRADRFRRLGVK